METQAFSALNVFSRDAYLRPHLCLLLKDLHSCVSPTLGHRVLSSSRKLLGGGRVALCKGRAEVRGSVVRQCVSHLESEFLLRPRVVMACRMGTDEHLELLESKSGSRTRQTRGSGENID